MRRRQTNISKRILPLLAYGPIALAALPDGVERVTETKIEMLDGIGAKGSMSWLDNNNLVIAVAGGADPHDWWIQKLVIYDTKLATAKGEISPGFLSCANPAMGIFNIAKGTLEKAYTSNKGAPAPSPTWYRWNRNSSTLVESAPKPAGQWNPSLCLETTPADANRSGMEIFKEGGFLGPGGTPNVARRGVRYLQPEHGTLTWQYSSESAQVFLEKPNQAPRRLDIRSTDLTLETTYLPFANTYLVAPGWLALNGTKRMAPGSNEMVGETPMITFDPVSGRVERAFAPRILKNSFPARSEASTLPVARGMLIYYPSDRSRGGGLYLATDRNVERVWCIDKPSPIPTQKFDSRCLILSQIKVSPDGCKAAFFSDYSTETGSDALEKTAKVVDLCAH